MVLAFSGLLLYAYVQVIALVSGCMCVSVCLSYMPDSPPLSNGCYVRACLHVYIAFEGEGQRI